MKSQRASSRSELGYNLVEVLIAMAILAVVIISIFGLFLAGQRNVYSGKQMTQAVSIANRVMEDITQLSKDSMYAAFGVDIATTTLGAVDIDPDENLPNDIYEDALWRTTRSFTAGQDPSGFLQRWSDAVAGDTKLAFGTVHVVMMPRDRNTVSGTVVETSNIDGEIVRVRVIVRWQEATRHRQLMMDTIKFD